MAVDPDTNFIGEFRLQQEEMLAFADFQVRAARDRRAGLQKVRRIQQPGAVLALIAARLVIAAMRAGSLDIAVRQETAIINGIDLARHPLIDKAVFEKLLAEMLGQFLVLLRGRAAEIIEGEVEGSAEISLNLMLFRTELRDILPFFTGGELSGRTMLIRRADKQHFLAAGT